MSGADGTTADRRGDERRPDDGVAGRDVPPGDALPLAPTLPVASAAETRRRLAALARPHRGLAVLTVGVLVAATTAGLLVPRLLGEVVDVVNEGRPTADLDRLALALVVAAVAQGALAGWGMALVGRLGEVLLAALRERVVSRALDVPLADVERTGTGDLVARVCGDVDAVSEATREAVPEIVSSALIIGLTLVGLGALDGRLALAGLAAVPIQVGAARWYLRRSGPIYAAERAAEGARSHEVHGSVVGARTIRAFRLQDVHLDRIDARSRESVRFAVAAGRVRAWFFSRLNGAELVGLGTVLVVGFLLVRNGTITVGAATAAALYFHRLFDPIGGLLLQLDTAQAAGAALARLVGVLAVPPPPEPERPATVRDASVAVEGVRFAYEPGAEVLHGVDLHLRPGERVALVGVSGAGKTTLAKLLVGVHSPAAGTVRLGGAPVDEIGPADLRRTVALVSQEVHVFAGTLADDLRLARPDATDDELRAALDRVGATPWVEALPDGLATVVNDGPHQLGPTEAQQLALARLVLADPRVAVLDEATAEAGSAGARRLEAAADRAVAGRTTLVVAHRLTQAVAADRIVVLDKGTVLEAGTHDELLAAGGAYAELWSAWSATRAPGGARPHAGGAETDGARTDGARTGGVGTAGARPGGNGPDGARPRAQS
ncbi:MAG TPA: ABC transporter ATP-binding protein [Acidimicrobiales bacterium]